jgi:hypothetical protein
MTISIDRLDIGDIVEIKYKVWRKADDGGEALAERWMSAHICRRDPGTRPMARLADGQLTEIRPFMEWRLIARARMRLAA